MMKKILSVLLISVMVTSIITGCGSAKPANVQPDASKEPNKSKEPLRVAVQSFYCSSLAGLFEDEGWPEADGLPIEFQVFSSGATINEAMGEWDVAITGGAFVYALANYDCKLIAHQIDGTDGNYVLARNGDEIIGTIDNKTATAEKVRGKTILTAFGTTGHYTLNLWLDSLGVSPDECNIVNLEIPNIYSSWVAGEGDYCVMTAPYCYYNMDEMNSKIIATLDTVGGSLYEATVCTKQAYENRYDDIVTLVEWIYRATDKLNDDPDLAKKVVKGWYTDHGKNVTDEDVLAELTGKPFITSEQAKKITLGEFATSYAGWFASRELIESSRLSVVTDNVASDVYNDALSRFSK